MSARLRDDPKLLAERIGDEMRLFLRAQLLMDYWLRMTAAAGAGSDFDYNDMVMQLWLH